MYKVYIKHKWIFVFILGSHPPKFFLVRYIKIFQFFKNPKSETIPFPIIWGKAYSTSIFSHYTCDQVFETAGLTQGLHRAEAAISFKGLRGAGGPSSKMVPMAGKPMLTVGWRLSFFPHEPPQRAAWASLQHGVSLPQGWAIHLNSPILSC